MHFNPAAFRRPLPNGNVGNLGNAPIGVLRHPGYLKLGLHVIPPVQTRLARECADASSGVRLFNQVEFIALNADYLFGANGVNTSPDTREIHHYDESKERGIDAAVRLLARTRKGEGIKGEGHFPFPLPFPLP